MSELKGQAVNPYLPLYEYIPDVESYVFGDRVYIYGSHDQERGDTFCMLNYTVWSAPIDNLSNWRCEGDIYCAKQDPLSNSERPYMYAPDVVRGNDGRYYLYYCLAGNKGKGGYNGPISVAVCNNPAGKYEYYGVVQNSDGSIMGPMHAYNKPEARAACLPHLQLQLHQKQPLVLFGFGNVVAEAIFADKESASVKELRGNWYEFHGTPIGFTYHPLAVRRRPNLLSFFVEDLKGLKEKWQEIQLGT